MPVTFNEDVACYRIFRYDASAGTFSADLAGETAFDYFGDDADVGDYLCFALDRYGGNDYNWHFRNVRLYVGTPLVASAITLVWEYSYNASTWEAIPDVVNGDAMLSAGAQEVSWSANEPWYVNSHQWTNVSFNGVSAYWVRCRISAVTNLTEGGAQSTQTVRVGDNWIRVSGGTAQSPLDFDDIYAADVANGWGVCERLGYSSAYFGNEMRIYFLKNVALQIDGYFVDKDVSVFYGSPAIGMLLSATGVVTLGETDATTGLPINGGSLIRKYAQWESQGLRLQGALTLLGYYCDLGRGTNTYMLSGTLTCKGCTFAGTYRRFTDYGVGPTLVTVYDTLVEGDFLLDTSYDRDFDNFMINGDYHSEEQFATEEIFDGIVAKTLSLCMKFQTAPAGKVTRFRNCYWSGDIAVTWYLDIQSTDILLDMQEEYSYDLEVTDGTNPINGARVRITDSEETVVTQETTDGNGEIVQQWLVAKGWFDQHITIPGVQEVAYYAKEDMTSHNPHVVKIGAYAYQPIELSKTILGAVADTIPLQADPFITEPTEATALAYTGISVDHGTETVTITEAHSINELYDYLKALNVSSATEFAYPQILATVDGVNWTCAYNLTVDGVTLSGSGALNLGSKTFTAQNGGGTTLTVTDVNGTLVAVTITNVVVGSRWRIEETDGTEIDSGEAASDTVAINYLHTVNVDVNIIVRKSSGSPKYLPWSTQGTITSSGLTVRAAQIVDSIAS